MTPAQAPWPRHPLRPTARRARSASSLHLREVLNLVFDRKLRPPRFPLIQRGEPLIKRCRVHLRMLPHATGPLTSPACDGPSAGHFETHARSPHERRRTLADGHRKTLGAPPRSLRRSSDRHLPSPGRVPKRNRHRALPVDAAPTLSQGLGLRGRSNVRWPAYWPGPESPSPDWSDVTRNNDESRRDGGPAVDAAFHRLATYGTLAPGRPNHRQLDGLKGRWWQGKVNGVLLDAGWGASLGYPGLVLDPDATAVDVHVFESADLAAHWARLDAFEGRGYQRVVTTVQAPDGDVEASIYVLLEQSHRRAPD